MVKSWYKKTKWLFPCVAVYEDRTVLIEFGGMKFDVRLNSQIEFVFDGN